MNTITHTTLLDLVQAVSEYAHTDAEVVATVAELINSGRMRLCGTFAGARIGMISSRSGAQELPGVVVFGAGLAPLAMPTATREHGEGH